MEVSSQLLVFLDEARKLGSGCVQLSGDGNNA